MCTTFLIFFLWDPRKLGGGGVRIPLPPENPPLRFEQRFHKFRILSISCQDATVVYPVFLCKYSDAYSFLSVKCKHSGIDFNYFLFKQIIWARNVCGYLFCCPRGNNSCTSCDFGCEVRLLGRNATHQMARQNGVLSENDRGKCFGKLKDIYSRGGSIFIWQEGCRFL